MSKGTNLFEEIKILLGNDCEVCSYLYRMMKSVRLPNFKTDKQCVYDRRSLINFMILLKILNISSIYNALSRELKLLDVVGKDVLYKIQNAATIPWRSLLYKQARHCWQDITCDVDVYRPWTLPCFIIDDSDLPKRGMRIERIGKIFSHISRKSILGFKCLSLCFWSGKHLLHLDFSLHGEGESKGQGLTKKQLKNRFSKSRETTEPGYKRGKEFFKKKTEQAISMLRRAVRKKFKAAYILADSWFFGSALVRFALDSGIHLVSRPKFNNWKYEFAGNLYTVGGLVSKFQRSKKRKWNKEFRMHHICVPVFFQGLPVTIFLYKEKKRGSKWQALITTDKQIGAIQAFKVYQNRWCIEVSYKELKQYLQLGMCQSLDFDAQVAHTTQCLMAYNYLSHLKAARDYETIGCLFRELSTQWLKPTIMERFWKHLFTIITRIASLMNDTFENLFNTIKQNDRFFEDMYAIFGNDKLIFGAET